MRDVPSAVAIKQYFQGTAVLEEVGSTAIIQLPQPVVAANTILVGSEVVDGLHYTDPPVLFELIDQDGNPVTAEAVLVTRIGPSVSPPTPDPTPDPGETQAAVAGTSLPITVTTDVLEFLSGVHVERLSATFGVNDTQVTVAVPAPAPGTSSFVILSGSIGQEVEGAQGQWSAMSELINGGSSLLLTRLESGVALTVGAQIVTFDADSGATVQNGTLTVDGTATSSYLSHPGQETFLVKSATSTATAPDLAVAFGNGVIGFATGNPNPVPVTYAVVSIPGIELPPEMSLPTETSPVTSLTPWGPITAMEGVNTNTIALGLFTDSSFGMVGSQATAQINWGDGSISFGQVLALADAPGQYVIAWDHTYSESGTYPVTVSVWDGTSVVATTSLSATVSPYQATDDTYYLAHDRTLTANATSGYRSLFENDKVDPLSLTLIGVEQPQHGSLTVASDGSFIYTPQAGYVGLDSFTYTVQFGATVSAATATIYVQNTGPLAFDDTFYGSFSEGFSQYVADTESFTGSVLANDFDLEDAVSVVSYSQPQYGTVTVTPDGRFTYTPGPNFAGTDFFFYTISDGMAMATARVQFQPLPAGVAPLGENALVRASQPQIPTLIPPADMDLVDFLRAGAMIKHIFAKMEADIRAGRLTALVNQAVGDKPIQINDDVALWADKDGKVHGSVLFGRVDAIDPNDPRPFWEKKDQPFGTLTYTGSQFIGELSIPRVDDTGRIINVDTLMLDKNGLTGVLPLMGNTKINFDKGFSSIETGDKDFDLLVDKKGNFKVWAKKADGERVEVISRNNDLFKIKTIPFSAEMSKDGFTLTSKRYGSITATWQNWKNPTKVDVVINLGRDRTITLGYDYTQGPLKKTISAILNTPTTKFGFNYSSGKVEFTGSYKWTGNTAPYGAIGYANVKLTLDNVLKQSSIWIQLSVEW